MARPDAVATAATVVLGAAAAGAGGQVLTAAAGGAFDATTLSAVLWLVGAALIGRATDSTSARGRTDGRRRAAVVGAVAGAVAALSHHGAARVFDGEATGREEVVRWVVLGAVGGAFAAVAALPTRRTGVSGRRGDRRRTPTSRRGR